eukprot:CAMPEP_0116846082 /NCGR_PEP_ID=MMETSP0418-20121206/13638_1 /TAXON_ID=1158023 /ORGANISM="Astrosyne radiata, Strain 13vi08-1A" /LENGTH=61 /DNA_ID=CAMNT_0004477291 /DNA_START=101 /DNA_END=286 /DNA_ORIENTATION=-
MIMVPNKCTIHQSMLDNIFPLQYQQHDNKWMKNNVTEKSKHFLDFSTTIANNNALWERSSE